ncbi:ABC transporter ATP-binding protein [Novilysobacter arseniciresistens]|uniref:ABC transporter ATP-binding protein n=1 Tax=Novilysobacter arseniciresistens TaxID=1385522 RepID=UPI0006915F55|nr:ABC transporter ATP-binding protein [Lysobacter arseniciresistens]
MPHTQAVATAPGRPVPALSIHDLRKTYDAGPRKPGIEALKGVSLDVAEGDFFALLGPNGAGKSTLIGIVSSLVNLSSGSVRIFGTDITRDRDAAMRLMGLVPQEINFNTFEQPLDILVNYAGFYGVPREEAIVRAEEELRRAQLWDKARMMSRTLSGGMKRRLMIARAMMTRPRLLILDEPTAGVDIEIRRGMWQTLREINAAGTTIILTTHYLEEAEHLCRNLAIIDRGTIVASGPMKALLARLDVEGFVLDIDGTLPATLPEIPGITVCARDDHTLDIDMPRAMDLNQVFAALDAAGIRVRSMRTKSNRLEELFVSMVTAGPPAAAAPEARA